LGDDTHVPATGRNYRVASSAIARIATVARTVAATTAAACPSVGL